MNFFVFDGKSSLDFGLYVEHYPIQYGAKRKIEEISIPGRNGSLHFDEGAFEDCTQIYECAFVDPDATAYTAHAVREWLYAPEKRKRLEDSYDPEHFRLARFLGPLDVENKLGRIGKCKVKFQCDPRHFLKNVDSPIGFSGSGTIRNHWFDAAPLILVSGTGPGAVTIGETTLELLEIGGTLPIKCETLDEYREMGGVRENANASIRAEKFPILKNGDTPISFSGGVTKIEIIPRWWEL